MSIVGVERGESAGEAWPSVQHVAALRRRLLDWYREHARDLPWRRTQDPYAIWVSEIMLQQTQVTTVIPYFQRFLAQFPTIADLAQADEQTVLKYWEGLGYYRRARQMHRAAQEMVAQHQGRFPRDAAAVRALPGIGRYTAGAILSIAFDAREPILEANTIRLFSRLVAYRGDTSSNQGQRRLWEAAEGILPAKGSGLLNQALMDVGSMICTPRDPRCLLCPLNSLCPTNQMGLQHAIPVPRRKPVVEEVREATIIVRQRGKVLLLKRADNEKRWAGMWDFPRFSLGTGSTTEAGDLRAGVRDRTRMDVEPGELLTVLKHGVTRFRITLECYEARWVAGKIPAGQKDSMKWLKPTELADYPLSVTARKIATMLLANEQAA